jgi:drug/metabolite transporter (DMT)-like permease
MKLNFWQIIGLIVLLAGVALVVWEKNRKPEIGPTNPSATSPSTPAATQP